MKRIQLTRGFEAIVDDPDYDALRRFKWHAHVPPSGHIRAVRWASRVDRHKRKMIYMSRVIALGDSEELFDFVIDHINGNTLDNRRCNLRITDKSGNAANSKKPYNGVSKYKGVSPTRNGKWSARINKGVCYCLGTFDTEGEAAKAYNVAASAMFGSMAKLNDV